MSGEPDPGQGATLIATSDVCGTRAFDAEARHIGSVEDLVLHRVSGHVSYAVLSLGGFLGLGSRRHPVPWSALSYDTGLGGYVVNVDPVRLQAAPGYEVGDPSVWGSGWGQEIDDYYRPPDGGAAPAA